jgi:FolB domain-containing protein
MNNTITDTLFINDLILPCTLGVPEGERNEKQMVIINIAISANFAEAGKTDAIEDTINVHDVCIKITNLVANSSFHLFEALAQAIASECLTDNRIKQIKIHIEKIKGLRLAKSCGIEIIRSNINADEQ